MISYFKSFFFFFFGCILKLYNVYVAVGWVFMRIRVFPCSRGSYRRKGLPRCLLEMRAAATMLLRRLLRLNSRLTQDLGWEFTTSLARRTDPSPPHSEIGNLIWLGNLSNNRSFVRSRKKNQRGLLQLVFGFKTISRGLVENLLNFPILLA